MGLDLATFVAGKTLEDPGVLGMQPLDVQAASGEQSVAGVAKLAEGHGVLEPPQCGQRGPCMEREDWVLELNLGFSYMRNGQQSFNRHVRCPFLCHLLGCNGPRVASRGGREGMLSPNGRSPGQEAGGADPMPVTHAPAPGLFPRTGKGGECQNLKRLL